MRALVAALWLIAAAAAAGLALRPAASPALAAARAQAAAVSVASSATYVSLRAINAALSFAQEIEVGASVVASGNVQPFKWLEPVDDTVERVSSVVFAIAVLTGLLSLSLGPVTAVGFAALALFLAGQALRTARPGAVPPALARVLDESLRLGLALAILLPIALIAGEAMGDWLTAAPVAAAEARVDEIVGQAKALIGQPGASGEAPGWRETAAAYFASAGLFWERADALLADTATLVGSYILRLLLLPGLLLLVLWRLVRAFDGGRGQ
ncbi:MAG: hypothetical protein D6801_01615 [Alphaproteobacteria bacterium]|nr:MAG: hypothetical protein D6801_01615 [Alphaproteobacteria bacterium]